MIYGNKIEKDVNKLMQLRYGIIGDSAPMKRVIAKLMQAAPTDLTVLITGETGTGKEVFANAIHTLSNRKSKPFISVNCAAIPETLLESELFGHEKGAFTGASDQRLGFFESAHNGTIFLDELGEIPLGTQVKLLRVLESGEFSRLGSSEIRQINVRVIAATNRDLEQQIERGDFRRDLYYRLNSVHIELPSLREHREDIPALFDYFAEKVTRKIGIEYQGIGGDALSILKSLHWSGNIRELRNMAETIVTLEKGEFITPEILRKYIPAALPEHKILPVADNNAIVRVEKEQSETPNLELGLIFRTLLEIKSEVSDIKRSIAGIYDEIAVLKDKEPEFIYRFEEPMAKVDDYTEELENKTISEIEKIMIEKALARNHGNRRNAAKELGISERTLYRKITEYDLV
jgi:transcriptional regulator with PAS, ATPase and Fis domain